MNAAEVVGPFSGFGSLVSSACFKPSDLDSAESRGLPALTFWIASRSSGLSISESSLLKLGFFIPTRSSAVCENSGTFGMAVSVFCLAGAGETYLLSGVNTLLKTALLNF